MRWLWMFSLGFLPLGCGSPRPLDYPTEAVEVLTKTLSTVATLPPDGSDAGYHVYDLGTAPIPGFALYWACEEPAYNLLSACEQIKRDGLAPAGCTISTALVDSGSGERCAIRLGLPAIDPQSAPRILAVDLDSCTSNTDCQLQVFSGGCETVIQRQFQAAGLAVVNAATWTSPRTHVQLHGAVPALRPLDEALCDEAAVAALSVCDELTATMPFVAGCRSYVRYLDTDTPAPSCAVRFDVRFARDSPATGVVTPRLDGLLSFRIQ